MEHAGEVDVSTVNVQSKIEKSLRLEMSEQSRFGQSNFRARKRSLSEYTL